MAIGGLRDVKISLARRNEEPEPSNITYFYDECDIFRFGLNEVNTSSKGLIGVGLMLQRIADEKKMHFIKSIDPIITHRLQRAFYQNKKFRKMSLRILDNTTIYTIKFEDIRITSLRQQFESSIFDYSIFDSPIIMDIVSIEANYAELV